MLQVGVGWVRCKIDELNGQLVSYFLVQFSCIQDIFPQELRTMLQVGVGWVRSKV